MKGSGRHRRPARFGRGSKRAAVAVLDQGLYSVANFVLTVLIAREVSPTDFGAYSLILASYILILGALRGLTAEVFLVRYSTRSIDLWRSGAASASGVVLLVGVILGVAFLLLGLVGGGSLGHTTAIFSIFLPALLVQDIWRYLVLALGRPDLALANDTLVTIVQFLGAGLLIAAHDATAPTLVGSWGLAALVGAFAALLRHRVWPRPTRFMVWLKEHRDLAVRFAADDLMGIGALQATTFVLAAVAGLAATGAFRGAQTIFGPLMVINAGVTSAITPELIRIYSRSPRSMERRIRLVTAALTAATGLWGVAVIALPRAIGAELFGATWSAARPLIVYFVFVQIAYAVRVGPSTGLRALGNARRTIRARLWASLVGLLIPAVGAAMSGARGAAVALAIASPLQAVVWWRQYRLAYAAGAISPPSNSQT